MMERFNVRRLFPWSSENGMLKVAVGGLSIIKIFIQKSLFSNFFVNLHKKLILLRTAFAKTTQSILSGIGQKIFHEFLMVLAKLLFV